jgi:OOP family OmpA-OmpF porin
VDTDGVSSGDHSGDDLNRLVTLTERKHELWDRLTECEDEELRNELIDQLTAYREELARLRATISLGLDEPATTAKPAIEAPQPPHSVGETLRSSLLLPPEELAVTTLPSPVPMEKDPSGVEDQRHVSGHVANEPGAPTVTSTDRMDPERVAPSPTEPAQRTEEGLPVSGAAVATEADSGVDAPSGLNGPHRSASGAYQDLERVRPRHTRSFPIFATLIAIGAVAATAWLVFVRPGGSTDTPESQTETTVNLNTEVSAVDQIRAVLDGLGYGSVVLEERSGTIYLGGIVGSESDRNAVIGATQALTRGMPLDSGSLTIGTALEGTSEQVGDGLTDSSQQPVVEAPVTSGPYVEATLDGKDFVLAGVVPSGELAGQLLRAAEIAYSPNVRSELVVDEQLDAVDWLSRGPDAIVLLPMIIDGQILIADGQVEVSGRSPDEAGVERLQGALSQTTGLPVVVRDMEVANLQPPTYVIAADAGVVGLEGRVPSEEIRDMLVEGAVAAYGEDNVSDRITVDPTVYPSLWMYSAGPLMQAMSTFPDYELHIDGMAFSGFINGGVTFESNSATFSGNYAEVLDVGVGVLTRDPSLQLVIEGHTDNLGSDEANLALSQLRADAVRDYFIANGIDPSRLTAVGLGETEPVVSNDTAEGRARNRRIQYVLSTSS